MRVTRQDVARLAGVSTATVSYVLNNGPRPVADETRQRILDAIEQLKYKPNLLARGLTTGRTKAIGIIIPDISDPFFPELILGAESVARDYGYNVFLCNANRDPRLERHYVNALTERQVDGLMLAGSRLSQEELLEITQTLKAVILTPFVVSSAVSFSLDDFGGGRQVGEYLLSIGHRQIRFLEGAWRGSMGNRYQGVIRAMKDAGVATEKVLINTSEPVSTDLGRKAALDILQKDPAVTALVCYNDVLALGVVQACAEMGIRIPQDISVVGFDDIADVMRFHPNLTTVRIDRRQLGMDMMAKMVATIESDKPGSGHIIVPVELIQRETCAPPRTSHT